MNCSICNKTLKEDEGFISNVNKDCKELELDEEPVIVCGPACKFEFEKSLPMKGKPIMHLSRITGYYQVVENWNVGKQQEFYDRKRYVLDGKL
jgi:hypothetical protein